MLLTLEQLRATYTEAESIQDILDVGAALGFQLDSWQSGAIRRSIVQGLAKFARLAQSFAAAVSYLVYNDDATGTALTELSRQNFGNTKGTATPTVGTIVFTGGAVGPPYTVGAGVVVVTDGTYTFRNGAGFTIPNGGTVSPADFYCETPGAVGNVANNTITQLVTTYVGVTCNNPAIGSTGLWYTTPGVDEEAETALKLRNSARWSTLSVVDQIDDRFEYVARTVVPNCRVRVDSSNPRGPGTLDVWIAGAAGVATAQNRTDIDAAITAQRFGKMHEVYCSVADAQAFGGTIYYTGTLATVQTAVEAAIRAYVNAAPVGGYDHTPGPAHVLLYDALIGAIRSVPGVVVAQLTTPSSDVTVGTWNVATVASFSFAYTSVG